MSKGARASKTEPMSGLTASKARKAPRPTPWGLDNLAGETGLEPATLGFGGPCSTD